ncbi:MAG TPA: WD40 repeat domain-containing serine/threonine protein kinase [Gemmataceae bacterium]|nr:WD40 repeat domain-containing serine/threonine protein kinase [Gemmataceae bacterium]
MNEPAFQRVEELFHRTVEVEADRRSAFLDAACGGDAALRAAVQELLDHDAAEDSDFLASPVARPTGGSDAPTRPAPPASFVQAPAVPGYEIVEEIGRGGMGVVYKSRHINLNRIVALKMLLPATPGDLKPLARFRTEAEVLARLHHPNIVPIYDIGEAEKRPYFTMEYIAGPNLARFMDGRPQDPTASARFVETLARAVHAAHEAAVVHRDLKPANILLAPTPAGGRPTLTACEPRITDFGLAKDATAPRALTQTGLAVGTPCYMAPEQARGEGNNVRPATDIYALGTILYEMLTGRPPFDAETAVETMRQVVCEDPVSPTRLRPRLPRDLVVICMKCLEKPPGRRYASALDLAEDLRCFQAGEPIRARPAGFLERACRWCSRRPLTASLLALVVVLSMSLVGLAAVYEIRLQQALQKKATDEERLVIRLNITIGEMDVDAGDLYVALLYFTEALHLEDDLADPDRETRASIAAILRRCPRLVRLTTFDKPVVFARVGPSGGWVALAGEGYTLEIRDVTTGQAIGAAVSLDAAPLDGAFSADGGRLVVIDAGGAMRVGDATAGRWLAGPIPVDRSIRRVAFSADGARILLAGADGVVEVRQARTGERVASPPDSGRAEPQFSPDGGLVLGDDAAGGVHVWETATGWDIAPSLHEGGPVKAAAFRPDGKEIVVVGADGVVCTWRLPPVSDGAEDRPPAELTPLAQVLAGARLDENEQRQPLDARGLKAAWDKLPHEP